MRYGSALVSIHAPYIGSDRAFDNFSSSVIVSIHAPYIGSDLKRWKAMQSAWVSIHAPYIGSDVGQQSKIERMICFNPRSLHRERRPYRQCAPAKSRFNPRSLHRERRRCNASQGRLPRASFNPRSLHRERRTTTSPSIPATWFQSTLPT